MPHTNVDVEADLDSGVSDTTLDELQSPYFVGEPLRRMVNFEYLDTPSSQNSDTDQFALHVEPLGLDEAPTNYFVRDEEINYVEEDDFFLDLESNGWDKKYPEGDVQSCTLNLEYVRSVIHHMAVSLNSTPAHPSHPLLVRAMHSTSASARHELALWRFLNSPPVRRDPWNASPPAIIVEREPSTFVGEQFENEAEHHENEVFIVMDHLRSLRYNPLKNTHDVMDFSRQILQSLVFFHEHNITRVSYALTDASGFEPIVMDIGLAPPHSAFSRYEFPVKYYLLDFTTAVRLQVQPICSNSHWAPNQHCPPQKIDPAGLPDSELSISCTELHIHSMTANTPMKVVLTLPSCYCCPVSSDSETPNQLHHFTCQNLSQELFGPEANDISGRNENGLWTVCAAKRDLLFVDDLHNVADLLEQATLVADPAREALTELITAMRQAKTSLLSADDALRMFESAAKSVIGTKMG